MRFEDEKYVRLYTRDTITWKLLPWQSKCLLPLIMRKLDRAGILDLGEDGIEGLAALLELPSEVVEEGLAGLIKRGTCLVAGRTLVMPRFLEGQETPQSDKARQRAYRERARNDAVTDESAKSVTRRHAASRENKSSKRDRSVDAERPAERVKIDATAQYVSPEENPVSVTRCHAASQPVTLNLSDLNLTNPGSDARARDEGPGLEAADPGAEETRKLDAKLRYAKAYATGIRRVDKNFPTPTSKWALDALGTISTSYARGFRGASLEAWFAAEAYAYRKARADKPTVEKGFSPEKFLEWQIGGRPGATSKPMPTPASDFKSREAEEKAKAEAFAAEYAKTVNNTASAGIALDFTSANEYLESLTKVAT